eukprot:TRINITY_DN20973_c0_g1_i1.p1 TRINITY_DN20973_c0_g1~~TRINITY_DN20973_c0_g1_i1.p1  ORF type:complete len:477 (+),score=82.78 TRINITY_DN20973_c0_g1_i1:38-1432(+)
MNQMIEECLASLRKGSTECMMWSDPSQAIVLSDRDMKRICDGLTQQGRTHSLSLSGNSLSEAAVGVLVGYLSSCSSLRVLDISFCGLTAKILNPLIEAISRNRRLKDFLLNASYNEIDDDGAVLLSNTISNTQAGGVRHLVLRYNPIQSRGVAALIKNSGNIESLDVSYVSLSVSSQCKQLPDICAAMSTTKLECIKFCGIEIDQHCVKKLQDSCPRTCTLLLTEDEKESTSLLSSSPVREASMRLQSGSPINREVEDVLWRQELALLRRSRAGSSSPVSSASERKATLSQPSSSSCATRLDDRETVSSSDSSTTIKSLSLALNLLHDNLAAVTSDRDRLKASLEQETAARIELSQELLYWRSQATADVPSSRRKSGRSTRTDEHQVITSRASSPRCSNGRSSISRRALSEVNNNNNNNDKTPKKSPTNRRVIQKIQRPKVVNSPTAQARSPPTSKTTSRKRGF